MAVSHIQTLTHVHSMNKLLAIGLRITLPCDISIVHGCLHHPGRDNTRLQQPHQFGDSLSTCCAASPECTHWCPGKSAQLSVHTTL